jgi:hypothetical protein
VDKDWELEVIFIATRIKFRRWSFASNIASQFDGEEGSGEFEVQRVKTGRGLNVYG